MKIYSNNYLNIQGWMRTKLGLKGNDLILYALIYGFSQDGKSEFTGSLSYISDWLGCARSTTVLCVNRLLDSNLIIKENVMINNVTYCKYVVNLSILEDSPKIGIPVRKSEQGIPKDDQEGIPKIGHNNKSFNNKDISNENISDSKDTSVDIVNKKAKELSGRIYMERTQMVLEREGLKISDLEYKVRVKEFMAEMLGTGEYDQHMRKLKQRFFYWLRKKLQVKYGKRNDFLPPTQATGPEYRNKLDE